MTHLKRGIVGVMLLALLVAGSLLVVWLSSFYWLPHPSQASQQELLRWLVLRDLKNEPEATCLTLVERLQAELKATGFASANSGELSDAYAARLRENADFLKRVWFVQRCRSYQSCREAEQIPFLRDQIDFVLAWSRVDWRELEGGAARPPEESPPVDSAQAREQFAAEFFREVEQWIDDAEPAARDYMNRAVCDGVLCWLATSDLAEEPLGTRRQLATRVARQLEAGMRIDQFDLKLDKQQQEFLRLNSQLLMEAWLHQQADAYAKQPPSERDRFVDQQIDNVIRWRLIDVVAPAAEESSAGGSLASAAKFMGVVQSWIHRAPEQQRAALKQLVAQVQQRFLIRQLKGQLPSPDDD